MPEPSPDTDPFARVARLADLPQDRGVAATTHGVAVLLVRAGEAVHAFSPTCPHAGAPLAEGAVCGGRLVCPWHKASFAVADGALLEPPALEGLRRYPVRIEDGEVWVGADPLPAADRVRPVDGRHFVVVGAGAAGMAGAAALRELGFGGSLTLIGDEGGTGEEAGTGVEGGTGTGAEPGEPYDRTALSKFVTAGQMAPEAVPPLRPPGFLAAAGIARIQARAVRLDVAGRRVTLADGRAIAYDAALLATGGDPVRPDLPGAGLAGVCVLRGREDARAILARAAGGGPAVVLGAGFIGLEVACGLRAQGLVVQVVAPGAVPFARQLGPELGGMLRALHEAQGVTFHVGRAARLERGGGDEVAAVVLEDGTRLPARLVVAGLGVRPATGLLAGLALEADGGVAVDAGMRAAPGLWAAGDIARFPLPDGRRVRVEHWRVAQEHARLAARGMLGEAVAYAGVPFFWTYHYGRRFEVLGHAERWDRVVVEGSLAEQDFVALLAEGERVAGVVACQRERATAVLMERMRGALGVAEALAVVRAA